MRRARDWVCGACGAIVLGSSVNCFACDEPRSASARLAGRQVTPIEDAGPRPTLDGPDVVGFASADAAVDVETTKRAAYYAAAASERGAYGVARDFPLRPLSCSR